MAEIKDKRKLLEQLLKDEHALVHVNAGHGGVALPEHLLGGPHVTLKISHLFPGRLQITEAGIEAELQFKNIYFNCILPFEAVWGISSCTGENVLWPEAAPVDIIDKFRQGLGNRAAAGPQKPAPEKPRGHLRRVK